MKIVRKLCGSSTNSERKGLLEVSGGLQGRRDEDLSVSQGETNQCPCCAWLYPELAASSSLGSYRAEGQLVLGRGAVSIFCLLLGEKRKVLGKLLFRSYQCSLRRMQSSVAQFWFVCSFTLGKIFCRWVAAAILAFPAMPGQGSLGFS